MNLIQSKNSNQNSLQGGLDTQKEMCLAFLYYYPKTSLTFCETAPDLEPLINYFGVQYIQ